MEKSFFISSCLIDIIILGHEFSCFYNFDVIFLFLNENFLKGIGRLHIQTFFL